MTEKKIKTETEAKAPKKAAAPKAEAKSAAPKPTAKAATEKKAPAKAGATITVVQTGSPIGRQGYQRATLIGLGLNKMQRQRVLEDSPSVRGMVEKVKHLVKVIE